MSKESVIKRISGDLEIYIYSVKGGKYLLLSVRRSSGGFARSTTPHALRRVRYIIINGYYYPDILRCANNNTVAHFLRSISVYLRTPRETLARARSYKTEVSRLSLTISRSIIDKMHVKRRQLSLFLSL